VVTGDDVRAAVAAATTTLAPTIKDGDWDKRAGKLRWSCRHTLAHIVDCLYWYASNLARRSTHDAGSPDVSDDSPLDFHLDSARSGGALLALAVDGADDEARGFHSFGIADRSGFAAMGCDEVLIHSNDIAAGLGVDFVPPPEVAERTLRRLFPWAPTDTEPWQTLLWANGREALGDRAPETKWLWHCAPLAEWAGDIRRMPK
jgi:hypothetical protein